MDGVDLVHVSCEVVLGKFDGLAKFDLLGGGICCCLSKVVAQRLHLPCQLAHLRGMSQVSILQLLGVSFLQLRDLLGQICNFINDSLQVS